MSNTRHYKIKTNQQVLLVKDAVLHKLLIVSIIFMLAGNFVFYKLYQNLQNNIKNEQVKLQILKEDIKNMQYEKLDLDIPEAKETVLLEGHVSYYSEAGCLGCREDRLMANGKKFDENAMTLAIGVIGFTDEGFGIPAIALNKKVLVRNLDNGKEVLAVVSDTGGFNNGDYNNRIADLSLGLARELEVSTDKSNIQLIEIL